MEYVGTFQKDKYKENPLTQIYGKFDSKNLYSKGRPELYTSFMLKAFVPINVNNDNFLLNFFSFRFKVLTFNQNLRDEIVFLSARLIRHPRFWTGNG